MIQEQIRLGENLILPMPWQKTLQVADGDELTVLYHAGGILIVKDPAQVDQYLAALVETPQQSYQQRIAEMAATYETSPLVQLASESDQPVGEMSPELETLYLEAELEVSQLMLPPLQEDTIVETPEAFAPIEGKDS